MDSLCPSHRDLISHYKCSHLEGKLMIAFINNINNDLEVAHPHSGSSSTWFLVKLEFSSPNIGFWREGKTRVPREKPLVANKRTNKKLNPHMASILGFEPRPHWWEVRALTTVPSLAPLFWRTDSPGCTKIDPIVLNL